MKRMTVPAMLAAGVLAFTLAGCAGNASESMTEDTLKGTWALEGQDNVGFEAYASFEDDSEFEMILVDSYLDGTWAVSGTEGTVTTSDDRTMKLSYGNNKLTVGTADGTRLVFVRDDSDETKELFSDDGIIDLGDLGEGADDTIEYVDEQIDEIEPVTIADDDKASIVITGKGTDFTGDPCYAVTFTNKTDKDVYFAADDLFKVGDKQVEAGLGDELEAGETLESEIYFAQDELGGGLELLTTVDGVIVMYDDETDEELARYTFHME